MDTAAVNHKKLIVVLGMHRSGTSAITRGLQVLGVNLGDRMMSSVEGNNAKGFWEDIDLNALNIKMLSAIDSDWHHLAAIDSIDVEFLHKQGYFLQAVELIRQKFCSTPIFGFKDPRVAKLLPFWKGVFSHCQFDVHYVIALRHPLSVVKSLAKRDGFEAEQSYLLWLGHVIASLTDTAGDKRVFVDYDRLMQSPERELDRTAKALELEVNPIELQIYKNNFLNEKLQHTLYQSNDLLLDDTCPPLVREAYTFLLDIVSDQVKNNDPHFQDLTVQWLKEFNRIKPTLTLADKFLSQSRHLNEAIADLDGQIFNLNQAVADRDGQIAGLIGSIREIHASKSWRVTAPLRFATTTISKARSFLLVLPRVLRQRGGLLPAFRRALKIIRNEGLVGIKMRARHILRSQTPSPKIAVTSQSKFSIVPYYIDPNLDSGAVSFSTEASIAVHLHLYYSEMLEEFVSYLNNIPAPYDLYVSVPESCDSKTIQAELNVLLSSVKSVIVECVPNRGRDIAPLVIQFGERLAQYEIIAHIHTKKSPHNYQLKDWCKDILDLLMGSPDNSGGRVAHLIGLLQTTAKIIFPEGRTDIIKDPSGWADNYDLAKKFLEKYSQLSINDFPVTEFSEGSMFWARTECLRDFLKLPLNYSDFPSEPIGTDNTLAHALERLILIFASKHQGQCIRIHSGDSIPDYHHYEDQQDYSSSIIHSDIKVLSYYLPQFHPTPENDLWHGKGFTEWTKVRAANPLFEGHYQQHIPHSDIGYYLLDSPDVLRNQAELMRQSGVHGQVFYHYWFSGKLILEEPAKLLLDNPDIHMPFCFCWANENWTRRWDGNEDEILLGQNYSTQDAHDFIHYLIPFFKDPRYIKVDDRPVLSIYRPSSIPNPQEYLAIWEEECAKVGLNPPYIVAVLTRGATNPKDFGMDAGVERNLHDWTNGAVPEIKNSLHAYRSINGSVLSYDEVVNFYAGQTGRKDFTYFRSVIPIWDNTARYGSEAYLMHGSTPQRFQEWLENTIAYTKSTLPADRNFVFVNAWNEWAEGAHLEPDSRYGYSYLNSVGRALSSINYSKELNPAYPIPASTKVHLSFPNFILEKLEKDDNLKEHVVFCLSRQSIINKCSISINAPELIKDLAVELRPDEGDADFILEFRRVALFGSLVIEKMIETACATGSAVIANNYNSNSPFIEMTENGSVHSSIAYAAPLLLLPKTAEKIGYKNFRMRSDARCIEVSPSLQPNIKKPEVTTIIRFHKSAEINELINALYCLSIRNDGLRCDTAYCRTGSQQTANYSP